ncbi:MAG: hypothetical protein WB682_02695 [Candidatus Dormiibacterota bacterium]
MAVAAQPVESRPARFMTWFALVVVIATYAAYSLLVRAQGGYTGLDVLTVPFVTGYMFPDGLLVLGIIALFSLGLPLVVAGAMATGAHGANPL